MLHTTWLIHPFIPTIFSSFKCFQSNIHTLISPVSVTLSLNVQAKPSVFFFYFYVSISSQASASCLHVVGLSDHVLYIYRCALKSIVFIIRCYIHVLIHIKTVKTLIEFPNFVTLLHQRIHQKVYDQQVAWQNLFMHEGVVGIGLHCSHILFLN